MSVQSDFHNALGDLINTVGQEIARRKGTDLLILIRHHFAEDYYGNI